MIRKLAVLYFRMLRYRAAMMIWMFFLLGAAHATGDPAQEFVLRSSHLWGLLALASSYVFATATNDLADQEIDRVNHPGDAARPLVTGEADEADMRTIAALAAATAVVAAVFIGTRAVVAIGLGLLISIAYSLPPLRISYRSVAAPLLLAVGYVAVPYSLGAAAEGVFLDAADALFLSALAALFLARISLKDFRDREGDALYGRNTLLLHYGKDATCAISLGAVLVGNASLLYALHPPLILAIVIELFFVMIGYALYRLRIANALRDELVMIGLGARLGNGLLVAVLGWLLLTRAAAPLEHRIGFVVVLAVAYATNFLLLRARPQEVLIGYKG
jgi:4-hydroxybenzoate polyprenyltransferase